jgi:hypothetical protein
MREHFAAWFTHFVAAAGTPRNAHQYLAPVNDVRDDLKKHGEYPMRLLASDDPMGRALAAMFSPDIEAVIQKDVAMISTIRGTQIFFAICAYRQEHGGQLPKTLEELVPVYLPQLSADPFASVGQTFRYRIEKDRWLIWSLGPNLKDDGGRYNWTLPDEREKHEAETDIIFASDDFIKARARALAELVKRKNAATADK